MGRGRTRKPGRRTKSGRLSRAGIIPVRIDKGNERAQMMTELYGTNGSDAIGRAFERGLLGDGAGAKTMLDTARAIHRAYWAFYVCGPIRCALADRNGASIAEDSERERRQEQWLATMLKTAGRQGSPERTLFDQLVVDVQPDCGPGYLDRILAGAPDASDWGRLATALDGLAMCAGVERVTAVRRVG